VIFFGNFDLRFAYLIACKLFSFCRGNSFSPTIFDSVINQAVNRSSN